MLQPYKYDPVNVFSWTQYSIDYHLKQIQGQVKEEVSNHMSDKQLYAFNNNKP